MPPEAQPPAGPGARSGARALATALACILLGVAFGALVWLRRGPEPAQQYLCGYLIELSLSVDNVFVFALVFAHFGTGLAHQRRLLSWGLAGAAVMRSALILLGLGALARFSWIVPALGVLILATGIKLAFSRAGTVHFDPSGGRLGAFAARHASRALAALVVLETADLVFALDSLPAVIAVVHDPALAIASNLFAILGLRSLFLVVSGAMHRLRYLTAGLAAVLSFIGLKMLAEPWVRVPTSLSLAVIAVLLAAAAAASLARPQDRGGAGPQGADGM